MKSEVLKKLEEFKEKHCLNAEFIIGYIDNLESKIDNLENDKTDLKDEINILNSDLEDFDKSFQYPKGFNDNIVVVGVLESLFENLDRIPVSDLEDFINKYAV